MDWKNIIKEIGLSGMTQEEIARNVCISQASVSDLARGRTKSPVWEVGDALIRLHKRVTRSKTKGKK